VATVDPSTGIVTGVSAGSAILTYTVLGSGGCSDDFETRSITVTPLPDAGTLSGVNELCVGQSAVFTSTTLGGAWSSSNPAVASINSSTGEVTAVSSGTITITYTVAGSGSCPDDTATRSLTINPLPTPSFTSQPTGVVCIGEEVTYSTQAGQFDYDWQISGNAGTGTLQFDGINDYISVGNIDIRNTSYSIFAWVKPSAFNRLNPIIGELQYNWFGLYFSNANLIARHRRQNPETENEVSFTLTDTTSRWILVTMVFDISAGMRLYINNSLVASNSITAAVDLAPPRTLQYIGRHSLSVPETQNYFLGDISTIVVYNRALNINEISKNFNATRGRYGI
jgi:hypothetical protein